MSTLVLLLVGAALPALWGISHLFATKAVVDGFGAISSDNREIITMEWIVEGVFMIFLGALVAWVSLMGPIGIASKSVLVISAVGLVVMAAVSVFTGFKVNFLPFKLCPFIFGASAALILAGTWL